MLRWLAVLALASVAAQEEKIYSNSYKGKAPPELTSEKDQWINSAEKLTLAGQKGKVVWLEFSFLN